MPETAVIGLDLGTSACKAIAFAADGRRLAQARVSYETRVAPDRVEQDPGLWTRAACTCLTGIADQLAGRSVAAIGLSGQIGTYVLVDDAGQPLADAVTWQDARSSTYVQPVAEQVPNDWLTAELDTRLPPSATWPLPRLAWLNAEFPDAVSRARYLLSPKDFLVWTLTGSLASDASSWRGITRPDGTVVTEALRRLGLPDLIPPMARPDQAAGGLTAQIATATGLPTGTPVMTGLSDLNAGFVGIGAIRAGAAFDIGGTSEHLGFVARSLADDWRVASVPLHAVDTSLYAVYGVTSNAGSVTAWVATSLLADGQDYSAVAGQAEPGAQGLLCVPYLYGERAPIWDPRATGGFIGLANVHGRPDFVRAALEGVAFNLRAIRDAIPEASRSGEPIRSTGGTARSPLWNQIKATVLHQPLQLLEETESAALGAAILAGVGAGVFARVDEGCAAMVRTGPLIEPADDLIPLYDSAYTRYTQAAALVRDLAGPNERNPQ